MSAIHALSGTRLTANPFETPAQESTASTHTAGNSGPLFLLSTAFIATLIFAAINSVEERLPTATFTLMVVLAAGLSQLPGIILSAARWNHPSRTVVVMLVPAYFVALSGVLAYLAYALNGKSDSLRSAAHMHVIMFPLLHCGLTAALYSIGGVVALIGTSRKAIPDNNTQSGKVRLRRIRNSLGRRL